MPQSPDHPELPFIQAAGFTPGRPTGPPLWVVVHTMEASESSTTAENTANYFANPGDGRDVSAHYCCDNNSIVQCVKLKDTAWTVGNTPGNNRGINWEFAGFASQTPPQWGDAYSTAMLHRSVPIILSDCDRYGIPLRRCSVSDLQAFRPGITSHNDLRLAFGVTTHTDPGPNFPWTWFIELLNSGGDMGDVYYLVQSSDPDFNGHKYVSNRIHRRKLRNPGIIREKATAGAVEVVLTDADRNAAGDTWEEFLDSVAGGLFKYPETVCTCNCDCGDGGGEGNSHNITGTFTGTIGPVEPPA